MRATVQFVLLDYSTLENKLDRKVVTDIITQALTIEKEFICEALPVDLIGMNSKLMAEYLEFVADRLLVALGCDKHYRTANPFDWMETISLQVGRGPAYVHLKGTLHLMSCAVTACD